ncbi:BREX-1 system adenine-specific DNA-methyltransferase PglX [Clostridium botulinum]|nr:BREX-1 system adenine-specific DNA-methyltransferase PglX [Clostridium botulinum]
MDKNKIKSFAIWARRSLIAAVSEKANRIGISESKIEEATAVQGGFKLEGKDEIFSLSKSDRDALVDQVREKGFEQVMEEVAYTWFNRFMGLRYMEVNDYLPTGVRILSSSIEGKIEPDVLTKVSEIIDELELNANEIYDLLDTGDTLDREKAYRIILVKQCNELGKIIPQMFEKISDYTELLLPDNLLEEGSVIRKMVEDIEESDWRYDESKDHGVEIVGWMYQYYISEKKDEVFEALKKNVKITKENIPAATQLFTPKWIVKYMVENSLGRLWLEGHPNEELQKEWKYYLEEAEQEPEVEEELKKIREEHSLLSPEDIKVLDPCMGSGHILVYAFDVLYEIYKTAGYSEREIPRMILQNNLYGLDIDDRAAQLASFALIMKARHYNRRLFREIEREGLELNLCAIQESNSIPKEAIDYFVGENENLRKDVEYLVDVFIDAKEYGSILEVKAIDFTAIEKRVLEIKSFEGTSSEEGFEFPIEFPLQIDVFAYRNKNIVLEMIPIIINQGKIMSGKYKNMITNPPYMGQKGMGQKLRAYLDKNFKNSKSDLFAVFMELEERYLNNSGLMAMINQHTWMFLQSFEKLRVNTLKNVILENMIHLGTRAFEEIGGEVVQTTAFVVRKNRISNHKSVFYKLTEYNSSRNKERELLERNKECRYITDQGMFNKLPNSSITYWLSKKVVNTFELHKKFSDIVTVKNGLSTTDNNRFLRNWSEIDFNNIGFGFTSREAVKNSGLKWFPYNKGGEYKKWYGNREYVVNWKNDGEEIREAAKGASGGRIVSQEFYFNEGLTWSDIGVGNFGARYIECGFLFDTSGPMAFNNSDISKYIALGYMNTNLFQKFANITSPGIHYTNGSIAQIPFDINNKFNENIDGIVKSNINISKNDWDSFETSWDFKVHPLLKFLDKAKDFKLSSSFEIWENECNTNFNQLKHNEEELNRIFIDIYGLEDELTPNVEDKDITIRKADRERYIKSFISYAVGCMFGRYSIDSEGLIYAGGKFTDKWAIDSEQCKVKSYVDMPENDLGSIREYKSDANVNFIDEEHELKEESQRKEIWIDASFVPDKDNIIPITEDEYFEDDIVSRFIEFVRTVYGNDTLEENLDFIADSIGRKSSETSRQAIRRYFIKDFYKDHLKVYQKRPIYWMFESGKNDGFKALIYMHRYNEQTIAKLRTDYLHTLQRKYESEINRLQLVVDSEEYTAKDRTAAKKKIARISKQLEECKEYDQVVAHFANEKISIDLDDGVKVNYAKFQGVTVINSKEKEVKMNLLAKI